MADDVATTRAAVISQVCIRVAAGESVSEVFQSPEDNWPDVRTFWRWLAESAEDTKAAYQTAITARGWKRGEEIVHLSDEDPPMVQTKFGEQVDTGWVQWQKNRIDARKWDVARMQPKVYGDKIQTEHSGSVSVSTIDYSKSGDAS